VVNNNCTTKALSFFGEGIVKETGFLVGAGSPEMFAAREGYL
jgi:hypothetical protein